jgi:hypothetical protein
MKTCDSCIRPEVCETSGWCHRAEEKADDRLTPTAGSACPSCGGDWWIWDWGKSCPRCEIEIPDKPATRELMKCPHCQSGRLWIEDRATHCDGCDDFDPEYDLPNDQVEARRE